MRKHTHFTYAEVHAVSATLKPFATLDDLHKALAQRSIVDLNVSATTAFECVFDSHGVSVAVYDAPIHEAKS